MIKTLRKFLIKSEKHLTNRTNHDKIKTVKKRNERRKTMTINELMKELEKLQALGYGDSVVVNEEDDEIEAITECGKKVVIYF